MPNSFFVLTIFPELLESFFNYGIIKRAVTNKKLDLNVINIRDFADNKHNKVDDTIYGGGQGMLMMAEPIWSAIQYAKKKSSGEIKTVLLSPQGDLFNNKVAKKLSKEKNIILICGRYEGFDERILSYVDEHISIGDFVLTGGEVAAMAVIDSTVRFIPGVLGDDSSAKEDSFEDNLLKQSEYTKPLIWKNKKVPDVLTSGNHKKIEEWRRENSLKKTFLNRFDLLNKKVKTKEDIEIIKRWYLDLNKILNNLRD